MSVIIDSDNNNVNITEEPINVTVSLGGPDVAAVWGGITGDLTDQADLQAVLDDKVPYTGATGDVNLGEYGIQLGNLEFDNTPTNVPTAAGSVYWSDTDGTLNMVLKGGQTISRIGETQHIRALNNTGAQIARGKVVYVVGAQGQRLTIALADADTEILSKDTIGFTSEAIADGAEGFVIVQGVINNVNTTGMSDGATVYLSQTAGSYTTTPPVDPAHLVVLGFIVNGGSGGAGSIYVKVDNGYELGELHDVNTTGATNGQVLTYNGTTWVADDPAAGGITSIATSAPITGGTITSSGTIGITQAGAVADGYLSSVDWNTFNNKQAALSLTTTGTSGAATLVGATLNIPQYQAVLTNPVTGTGTSGQVAYWSGTNAVTGSNNLFWDNANGRLGIGTTSPNNKLSIDGNLSVRQIDSYLQASGVTQISLSGSGGAVIDFRSNNAAMMRISNSGVFVGSDTTPSARLHVRGSGTTSSTTALLVQNSTPTELFKVTDDGLITIGTTSSTNTINFGGNNTQLTKSSIDDSFSFRNVRSAATIFQFVTNSNLSNANTSGTNVFLSMPIGYAPTSGTGTWTQLSMTATINQTGGANGITRGLYVNPTLTAAADWRSIETSNNTGWAIYTAGTANSYFGGRVGINTLSPAHQLDVSGNIRTNTYVLTPAIYSSGGLVFGVSGGTAAMSIRTTTRNTQLYDSTEPSDAGQRLQVYGSTLLRGSGTTSATTALLVQNSTPTELFKVLDNGAWNFNGDGIIKGSGNTSATTALTVQNSDSSNIIRVRNDRNILIDGIFNFGNNMQIYPVNAGGYAYSVNATELRFETTFSGGVTTGDFAYQFGSFQLQNTSNANPVGVNFTSSFNPTSGTQTFTANRITPTINQTGGANGITRGLYVNPTLTAAADWRSIEFSNNTGWGIYGAGTANNYLGGSLGIGTTSLTGYNIFVQKNISGASTNVFSIYQNSSVQSDVTGTANGIGSFTGISSTTSLGTLRHFVAAQGTFAAGGTVTTQIGYTAASTLTSATNNYGFYGDIASGTGRWNLYMNGTAANYLAGNTSIGTTTESARLLVRGSGTTSATTALLVQNSTPTLLMQITDDGNVGIGSAPLSNRKLYVTGATRLNDLVFAGATNTSIANTANIIINLNNGVAVASGSAITAAAMLHSRGAGTTSASNGLLVEDSAGTDTFTIRDDGGYAFKGGTVGLAQTGYTTFTNLTTDRTCDANATTVEELADILGTLIEDLKTKGIIAA